MTAKKTLKSLLAIALSSCLPAAAGTLTPVALFQRCYTQITQLKVPSNDARLAAVKSGAKDPIAACLEVLDSARWTAGGGTTLGDTSDIVAQAVLKTFQGLHYSWFTAKQYMMLVGSSPAWTDGTYDVLDPSSPALYYTKALFDPNASYKDVVTSPDNLRPIRSTMNPTKGAYTGDSKAAFAGASTPFVPTGTFLGAAPSGPLVAGGVDYGATGGGGYLGTQPYIQLSVGGDLSFTSDGAVGMPRRWGRDVFQDVLCRTLPVVRETDVGAFVVAGAKAPFRQSSSCVKCHASMDRAAAVVRNFRYTYIAANDGNSDNAVGVKFISPSKPAETSWPSSADGSYASRPPNGVLFYRSYDGTLIDENVSGIADLGAKLAGEDDFYICAAKRYFKYFTGINVETGDIADPAFAGGLSAADMANRQTVINLGKKLRSTQKLRLLIEDILNLPQYKRSDYGLLGN